MSQEDDELDLVRAMLMGRSLAPIKAVKELPTPPSDESLRSLVNGLVRRMMKAEAMIEDLAKQISDLRGAEPDAD